MPDSIEALRLVPIRTMLRLAMRDGREALFGADPDPVMHAVGEACPPFGTPDVNLEVPLLGMPGADVHVRCSRHHFHGRGEGDAGAFWAEHPDLLGWARGKLPTGQGIGVSYDIREPVRDVPAVYFRGRDVAGFFMALGQPELYARYIQATGRLPVGWNCWYTGSFPNRPGSPLRLGVVVDRAVQDTYVGNCRALEADLVAAGVHGAGGPVLEALAAQAAQPYAFDIELDVMPNGSVGDVVGINLATDLSGAQAREAVAGGSLAEALTLAQAVGLADERWHMLGDAAFRMLVPSVLGGERGLVACANRLVYVKLRLRDGAPLDVKAYFQTSWQAC